jgi:DNA-binding Lrp family transcriptional regulator
MKTLMPLKISDLDSEILRNLLRDGRMSYEEIAKKCGVSKNKIWKRLKSLEKKGIAVGATTQVNFSALGYDAIATLLIGVEAQQIDFTLELIRKKTEMLAYRQYNNIYNVRAIATLRNLSELDYVKQILRRSLPTMDLKTYVWMGIRNIPENMSFNAKLKSILAKNSYNQSCFTSSNDAFAIDALDVAIIDKLAADGRAAFSKIAKEIGLSTDTVIKRYHKLKEKGIVRVSLQINPNKAGYASILDFNIALTSPSGLSDYVIDALSRIPDVIILIKISGDYDLQLTAMVRSIEQSFALQDEISRICGTTKIEVNARRIPEQWPTPKQNISTF